jgi:hypothetical protein
MENTEEIKTKLKPSDTGVIAEIHDCTPEYVRLVFKGEKNNREIIKTGSEIIKQRERLIADRKEEINNSTD